MRNFANFWRVAGKSAIARLGGCACRPLRAVVADVRQPQGREALRHQGVLLVETIDELFDTAELLTRYPTPPSRGAAVMADSGAFRGFALDFAESLGLDLPELAPETMAALRARLPSFADIANPLDITAQGIRDPDLYSDAAKTLLADPNIGSLLLAIMPGSPEFALANARRLTAALAGAEKPVAYAVLGGESPLPREVGSLVRNSGIPFYRSPERAMRALARATTFGTAPPTSRDAARLDVPPLPGAGPLAEYQAKAWLAAQGVPVPKGEVASDLDAAIAMAKRLGYPVVLKAQSSMLTHKSDVGGVLLNIADEAALRGGWARLHDNLRRAGAERSLDGILVERMAPPGIEMVIGARRDAAWGPVVMIGLGGIWIETLKDVCLVSADLDEAAMIAAIGRLKGATLLRGARGAAPADIPALARLMRRIGGTMEALPELREIDLNPVMVFPEGKGVLVLDALVVAERKKR